MERKALLKLPLGSKVSFDFVLHRYRKIVGALESLRWDSRRVLGEPQTGNYIGFSLLQIGVRHDPDGLGLDKYGTILAAKVITHPRRKPFFVDPQHLTCLKIVLPFDGEWDPKAKTWKFKDPVLDDDDRTYLEEMKDEEDLPEEDLGEGVV